MQRQNLVFWGVLAGTLFTAPAMAQETIERGNQRNPHQPPAWFAAMATEPQPVAYIHDSFSFHGYQEGTHVIGRPHKTAPLVACLKADETGNKKWAFCRM